MAFQELQDQQEKEAEKKLQKPILALQETREQEEYETTQEIACFIYTSFNYRVP